MKIDVMSDLHLNFSRDFGKRFVDDLRPRADILILAGDIADHHWWKVTPNIWAELCGKYRRVLMVAGNHDYYGTNLDTGKFFFQRLSEEIPSFSFLENEIITIEGIKFAGATLWFPNGPMNPIYAKYLNDFSQIKEFIPAVYAFNGLSQKFLGSLEGNDADVIITHHLPSSRSIREPFINDALNIFFLCDMEEIIYTAEPKLWIHGHSHIPVNYQLHKTRVVCHPHGYAGSVSSRKYQPLTAEV